nr:HAD hydrolase-like protein [uncultured Caproiciproducens sp.]
MKPIYDLIIFDLDGTLTNSEPGITSSVKYALEKMGQPVPELSILRKFIGPPQWESFVKYCGLSDEQTTQAVENYREIYNVTGAFENKPYPGIIELLQTLRDAGATLAVATTKPAKITARVLDHFDLTKYFAHVSGPDDSERNGDKSVLINSCLNACHVESARAVMIGDTLYDTVGARNAGTDFIGVLYGFGTQEEMTAEGGKVFARDLSELKSMLLK